MAKNKKKSNDNANNNGSIKLSKTLRTMIGVLIALLLVLLGVLSFRFAYGIANGSSVDSPPGRSVQVYIHDSMSPGDVASMLEEKGLLKGTLEFVVHAKLKGYNPSKYTGSHTLNTSMNAEQQLNELMNLNGD